MIKLVSLFVMTAILLAFSITTSSCGENRNQYFEKTDNPSMSNHNCTKNIDMQKSSLLINTNDIKKVEENLVIDVKQKYVYTKPEFYIQEIFNKKEELLFIKELTFIDSVWASCSPAPFGWDVWEYLPEKDEHTHKTILLNNDEYVENNAPLRVYDKSNNLNYVIHKGVLRCDKVSKTNSEISWTLKMPSYFPRMSLCNRTIGDQIIAFNSNNILIVNTVNLEVTAIYDVKKPYHIFNVIPQNNYLWVIVGEVKNLGIFYHAYLIDLSNDDNCYKFEKLIDRVFYQNNTMILKYEDEIFIVDEKLALANNYRISDFHKDAEVKDELSEYKFEADIITFYIADKRYVLDINKPEHLVELPHGINALNGNNNGDNWDYCFLKDGYCYGYDLKKQETTWKIKTDILPSYSSEFGVLTVDFINKKIIAYGEKK